MGVVYAPVLGTVYCGMSDVEGGTSKAWKATECAGKSVDEVLESAISLPTTCPPKPLAKDGSHISRSTIRVVASRSHMNAETEAFIAELEKQGRRIELVSSGSSLKLCMVAEGSAEAYPRIAPTMEWDTAAAQAVVEASGGRVVEYDPAVPAASYFCGKSEVESGMLHPTSHILHPTEALSYNKADLLNPFFVVSRK